jgi:beta-galactosidase
MWCYYNNADEVELYVNGKSQGVRRKADSHQYHVWWRVKFEPGEVRVVARQNGVKVREERLTTASQPHHIRLTTDRSGMRANGRSLAFITAEIVDQYERVCPNAEQEIFFDVNGEGEIAGVDNGLQTSLERFKADKRKTFHGRCLLVMRSSNRAGNIFVTAKAAGLGAGTLKIVNK